MTQLNYTVTLFQKGIIKRTTRRKKNEEQKGHWCVYKWNSYVPTPALKQESKSSPKRAKPKTRRPTRSCPNKTLAFSYWLLGCKSVNCTEMMTIALVITWVPWVIQCLVRKPSRYSEEPHGGFPTTVPSETLVTSQNEPLHCKTSPVPSHAPLTTHYGN